MPPGFGLEFSRGAVLTISFDHELTPTAQSDFRELFGRQPLIGRILIAVICGMSFVGALLPRMDLYSRLLVITCGVLFSLMGTGRVGPWWRWWWRRIEPAFGDGQSGEINRQGVRWTAESELIPWSSFQAIKLG